MEYKATLASHNDANNLIKCLLQTKGKIVTIEKENHTRVNVTIDLPAFKKLGIETFYLTSVLFDVDIQNILERIASDCIIEGNKSKIINYDNYSFDELIEAAKNETSFINEIDEWDINCEN